MKTKTLLLILFISFISSCNQSTKDKPDDDFGIEQKNDGEFNGEFSRFIEGEFDELINMSGNNRLVFKNGKGDSVIITEYLSNETSYNLNSHQFVREGEGVPFPYQSILLDSIKKFPDIFAGKILKVKWGKFTCDNCNDLTPINNPVLLSISRPFENKNSSIDNEKDESNTKQESDTRLPKVGEIRGMIYGSTLSQVEEEIGCIDYNWERDNSSEDDNCPGKRLQVRTGMRCLDYEFVVYKNFVRNSKDEVSDLLVVVKDWGKKYSKVTFVGDYKGELDPYEHCQDR